jgi:hypothetical protein
MRRDAKAPIMVSGLGRSGSTWMLWFLSQHPRIHVHGQSPNLPWHRVWQWYQTMVIQGQWAARSNRHVGYAVAHYAASGGRRCRKIFKRLFREYMTGYGPRKPRWGLKWIDFCADPEAVCQFISLWPETQWVIMLRDPFLTINSAKNTFNPAADPLEHAARWVRVCRFIESYDAGRLVSVQIDRLGCQTERERRDALGRVLACLGEEPCRETEQFIREWPTVHKVKAEEKRTYAISPEQKQAVLEQVEGLSFYLEKMEYLGPAPDGRAE